MKKTINLLMNCAWFFLTVLPITLYGVLIVYFGDENQFKAFQRSLDNIWKWNK